MPVLDRTRDDLLSVTSGQVQRTVLSRQVATRSLQLDSTRRGSVITSTPDPSLLNSPAYSPYQLYFGSTEDIAAPPPVEVAPPAPPPFEIYQDPPGVRPRPIVIVTTPASDISVGQENRDPAFLDFSSAAGMDGNDTAPLPGAAAAAATDADGVWHPPLAPGRGLVQQLGPHHSQQPPRPPDQPPAGAASRNGAPLKTANQMRREDMVKNITSTAAKLKAFLMQYDPNKYDAAILRRNEEKWTRNIDEAFSNFLEAFTPLFHDELWVGTMLQEQKRNHERFMNTFGDKVTAFTLVYQTKVLTLQPAAPPPAPPSAPPPPGTAAGDASSSNGGDTSGASVESAGSAIARARHTAQVNVDIDLEKLHDDIKTLRAEVRKVADWEAAPAHTIEVFMAKVEGWKRQKKVIKDTLVSVKRNVRCHQLEEVQLVTAEGAVRALESEVDLAIENCEYEDEVRCLYSLNKTKRTEVKYPSFGGGDGEDFLKFKREMLDGFAKNRVSRDEQVDVLRSKLSGYPKSMVPEDGNIDTAWIDLGEMYGDASRVMKSKKAKLLAMGIYPKPGSKSPQHLKKQLQWLMDMEILMRDIIKLTETSEDLRSEFFNLTTLKAIKEFFPFTVLEELQELPRGSTRIEMESIFDYVSARRGKVKDMLKDVEEPSSKSDGKTGGGGGKSAEFAMFNKFKFASRNDKCRICLLLEADGDTQGLYDDHFNNTPYGCPRFAAMNTAQRRKIAIRAKMCLHCLDPKWETRRKGDKHIGCPAFARPRYFSCKGCKTHFLVCEDHHDQNKEKMDRCKEFWSGKGKVFSNSVIVFSSCRPLPAVPQPVDPSSTNAAASNHSCGNVTDLEMATKQLKEMANGSKVLEVPDGDPLFLFSYVKGKNRDLTCFYDKGCSHMMIQSDVPIKELDAVMTKRGPLQIGAAGNSTVTVKDEWAVMVDKVDGSKQVMVGVTCDQITSTFPLVKTGQAMKDIIKNAPPHKRDQISNFKVPEVSGGNPDILLGIMYESCHPVTLHTLPSGLFIARVKLANSGGYTACIGGPHRSFVSLSAQVGDMARLMSCFVDGLRNYDHLGAPKLPSPMVTTEDINFAIAMNKAEVNAIAGVDKDEVETTDDEGNDDPEQFPSTDGFTMQCDGCGDEVPESLEELLGEIEAQVGSDKMSVIAAAAREVETDEKLWDLKTMMRIMEEGLQLDYRCPKCRNCVQCKNAATTEKISHREEVEDEAIRNSVTIDLAKKKITARIPLRGDEGKFLSNNRQIALKVLQSQCVKVINDPEAKKSVVKSFHKLLDNGYAVNFEDLPDEHKKLILSKEVQHYLPWRVVHKASSVQTPVRTVMDASSKTPVLPDGRGGHCLNNLAMKGVVNTLDLITMLLRWIMGPVACSGDLRQFYTSIALAPDQYNLQRCLWRDDMNLDNPLVELVIISLIFGVRSVSALSERAILDLAAMVKSANPRLAEFLVSSRFVDDLADSDKDRETIDKIIEAADKLFESAGLRIKGWCISNQSPHPEVTHDNMSVDIGGMTWWTVLDTMSIKIPPLHFGTKSRGKLTVGTEIFDGTMADLKTFVPQKLTRRNIVSKFASLYDPLGKFTPLTAAMKIHVRKAVKETTDWDGVVTPETRLLWVDNYWRLHNMKDVHFHRPRIPHDAATTDLELIGAVDASNELKICGVWARFLRKNGEYSCQLVIGRSLLSKEGSSIPKEELEALAIGSNLLWVVRRALDGWNVDYKLLSDSVISLCWCTAENKRLSLYHRNRANQVKMNTDLSKLFFVRTIYNPADVATRSYKVQEKSVGPDSVWENGHEWMKGSIDDAIEADILKPALELRINDDEEEEFDRGMIFEKSPEILVRGHVANQERVDKIKDRAAHSNYILQPSKFPFDKVVRITSYVYKFIRMCKFKRLQKVEKSYKMYSATFAGLCWGSEAAQAGAETDDNNKPKITFDDEDMSRALNYWYLKATGEVEKFVKPETVAKLGVKKDGVLFCRSRILDGQRFLEAGHFEAESLGLEVGLSLMTPLVERFSPIAYSIAMFIHEKVGKHAGYETCLRLSLQYCHIIQGASLFKSISDECSKCKCIRKKYIEVAMGPVSQHQLSLTPAFHVAFCDLDGPYHTYVPGHERVTRNKKVITAKCYIMTFVCPVTKLTNLQVLEGKNSEAVLEGVIRMGCENGYPSCLVLDQETSFMKMARDAEISLQDLSLRCYKEYGIKIETAPVAGHNVIGLAERKIRAVQEVFEKMEFKKSRLHATGLQTVCKLIENHLNNLPMGYSFGRDSDNTPMLKIITPNLMKIGRLNSRSLSGPMKFPAGPVEYLKKVQQTYDAFYRIWNTSVVPKLVPQPKWYKDSPEVKVDDVVFFKKVENELSSEWTVGQVDSVVRGRDGAVRRVTVRYHNAPASDGPDGNPVKLGPPMFTDRAVRSLVRMFNVEDTYFIHDLMEVEKYIARIEEKTVDNTPDRVVRAEDGTYYVNGVVAGAKQWDCQHCCCEGHCEYNHGLGSRMIELNSLVRGQNVSGAVMYPSYPDTAEEDTQMASSSLSFEEDEMFRILTCLETNLDLP